MVADAAADARRPVVLERVLGQPADHPELITIPETGYLKGALLRAHE
jgi:23S rRNA (cytosine1962-C5)-methyltransferase